MNVPAPIVTVNVPAPIVHVAAPPPRTMGVEIDEDGTKRFIPEEG